MIKYYFYFLPFFYPNYILDGSIGLSNIALSGDNLELLASQLRYETRTITLQSRVATVNVPAELRYLNSQQTQIVL